MRTSGSRKQISSRAQLRLRAMQIANEPFKLVGVKNETPAGLTLQTQRSLVGQFDYKSAKLPACRCLTHRGASEYDDKLAAWRTSKTPS